MVRRMLQGVPQRQHQCLKHQTQVAMTSGQYQAAMTSDPFQAAMTSNQRQVVTISRQHQLHNRSLNQLGSMLS